MILVTICCLEESREKTAHVELRSNAFVWNFALQINLNLKIMLTLMMERRIIYCGWIKELSNYSNVNSDSHDSQDPVKKTPQWCTRSNYQQTLSHHKLNFDPIPQTTGDFFILLETAFLIMALFLFCFGKFKSFVLSHAPVNQHSHVQHDI